MKYYVANLIFLTIKEVEIEKETPDFVYLGKTRWKKISDYDCYFPSRGTAKQHLLDFNSNEIKDLKRQIDDLEKKMEIINRL
jgi:hypothetical protein